MHLERKTSRKETNKPAQISDRGSGFSKNTKPFVQFDQKVDDKNVKYCERAFSTETQLSYLKPRHGQFSIIPSSRDQKDSEEQSEALGSPNERAWALSEMSSRYRKPSRKEFKHVEKSLFERPCTAFVNDVDHMGPIFVRSGEKELLEGNCEDSQKALKQVYPATIQDDGFTRLNRIFPSLQAEKSIPVDNSPSLPIIVGDKQPSGSVRNGVYFSPTANINPYQTYTSETAARYSKLNWETKNNRPLSELPRSGYSLSNKYQEQFIPKTEEIELSKLHPLVAYRAKKATKDYMNAPKKVRLPYLC